MRAAATLLLTLTAACATSSSPSSSPSSRAASPATAALEDGVSIEKRETVNAGTAIVEIRHTPDQAVEATLPIPVDRAWLGAVQAYAQVGLRASQHDASARQIAADWAQYRRRIGRETMGKLLDCGRSSIGDNADSYTVTLQAITTLRPGEVNGVTTVRTLVRATAKPEGTPGRTVSCTSTGLLEQRIAEAVQQSARSST